MEMSLSILVARPPFFLALLVFAPASGSTLPASLSAAAPASAEVSSWPALALVSAVSSSSSSAVLKIWLGRFSFFFGAFPLHPGHRHFPRGV